MASGNKLIIFAYCIQDGKLYNREYIYKWIILFAKFPDLFRIFWNCRSCYTTIANLSVASLRQATVEMKPYSENTSNWKLQQSLQNHQKKNI